MENNPKKFHFWKWNFLDPNFLQSPKSKQKSLARRNILYFSEKTLLTFRDGCRLSRKIKNPSYCIMDAD